MRKFALLLALVVLGLVGAGLTCGGVAHATEARAYVWKPDGTACLPGQGCQLLVEKLPQHTVFTVGMGGPYICNNHSWYQDWVYQGRWCDQYPFYYNSWVGALLSSTYINVWARQSCPGGGYRFSETRNEYLNANYAVMYTGIFWVGGSCQAAAPSGKAAQSVVLKTAAPNPRAPMTRRENLRHRGCSYFVDDGWVCPEKYPGG